MPTIETSQPLLIAVAVLAYLLGSVPFGIVITRALGLGDLRKIGSGNIGATNVLRTGNKGAALATLLLDAGKGGIAVALARMVAHEDAAQLAALASFLGHLFPIWLGFKGGKGVATFLGTVLVLDWRVGLVCCATWALTAAITRISSLSALVAAALSSLWLVVFNQGHMILLTVLLTVLIYWKHWPNLERIKAGTEPKIGRKQA
ncbi:glycerol-3-phosphate 1-O-acyltransferase PlsY [Stagnihabitans tardus]|uniref:Glycerol-3-phosphate acyltransferase n=1 Tax=Stagnihabitans tardus TaxID=2699202 RepID=A0AAE5BXR3_9RHOB|nr:glycerol-3-phosphate 1-O-acyltransferase PlsY [Stagnihabitans tardus]NBZ89628.1 glycerol-3-phosphate 1-O-acyltransferase PlsY [Stagnihabitans tardus]